MIKNSSSELPLWYCSEVNAKQNLTNEKSTFVQGLNTVRQQTLIWVDIWYWYRSMSQYVVTRPQGIVYLVQHWLNQFTAWLHLISSILAYHHEVLWHVYYPLKVRSRIYTGPKCGYRSACRCPSTYGARPSAGIALITHSLICFHQSFFNFHPY